MGGTCAVQTGALITFAHELQHFVQYGSAYKVLVTNTLLSRHLPSFEPGNTAKAWNIPHEQDAIIVSKRVAEAVIGADAVGTYVASRIAAEDDVLCWKYFQCLSSTDSFDLVAQTIPWVERYRPQLSDSNKLRSTSPSANGGSRFLSGGRGLGMRIISC